MIFSYDVAMVTKKETPKVQKHTLFVNAPAT